MPKNRLISLYKYFCIMSNHFKPDITLHKTKVGR
nr:MAG TPA: hypothetical protein [Caudoviricetes sp.]